MAEPPEITILYIRDLLSLSRTAGLFAILILCRSTQTHHQQPNNTTSKALQHSGISPYEETYSNSGVCICSRLVSL